MSTDPNTEFRRATDDLFKTVRITEVAYLSKVSAASVYQARMREDAVGHRAPPKEWRKAIIALAERQAKHFAALAARLRQS